jgi:hypothetical protein
MFIDYYCEEGNSGFTKDFKLFIKVYSSNISLVDIDIE